MHHQRWIVIEVVRQLVPDDDGCNSNHLISRHVLTSSLSSLDEQSAEEKGGREAAPARALLCWAAP